MKTVFHFVSLLMIALLCVGGCGEEEPPEITNSQPVIDRVIVPAEVQAGAQVKLEAFAHDADGDQLTYTWEVSEGTVDSGGVWSVPSAAMSATVMVHVRDGVNPPVASSKKSVTITKPAPPPPPSAPEGMVLIPAGEFQMGSNAPEAQNDEQPVHTVYVDAFFMDKYEVTNLDYKKFVLANPRWSKDRIDRAFHNGNYLKHWSGNDYPGGKANHPVTFMSWYAAVAYAKWAGKRLPTEAEWERAARGGLSGKAYPWGDVIDLGKANYGRNVGDTTAVGKYPANGYGLYDMAGNVWEWCLDEYNKDFYFTSPRRNPISGANSPDWVISNFTGVKTSRVLRGGSWGLIQSACAWLIAIGIHLRARTTTAGFVVRGLSNSLDLYPFTPFICISESIQDSKKVLLDYPAGLFLCHKMALFFQQNLIHLKVIKGFFYYLENRVTIN